VLTLPVFGIRSLFDTNDASVISAVEDAFGGWRRLDPKLIDATERVEIRIDVVAALASGARPAVRHFCPDATRVLVHSTDCVGVSDPQRRNAVACVGPRLVADRAYFRESVLEALTFALLSHFDRHPIHAAGVARDGRAILLAGPSGAGKSTLAHLAHAAGLTVLNDDHVWVQREPTFRVWGAPGMARLVSGEAKASASGAPTPPATAAPGAPGASAPLVSTGERGHVVERTGKQRVELTGARTNPSAYVAGRATVCLLERGSAAALVRAEPHEIALALSSRVDAGFDRFPERHQRVVERLAEPGGWRLTLSADPRDALPLLEEMLKAN
jgi:energy-coupling factor transporter ATP-binding protein EcfA2